MTTRTLHTLALVAISTLALAACSPSDGEPATETTGASTTTEASAYPTARSYAESLDAQIRALAAAGGTSTDAAVADTLASLDDPADEYFSATDNGDGTIVVRLDGQAACLTVAKSVDEPGQVTDGECNPARPEAVAIGRFTAALAAAEGATTPSAEHITQGIAEYSTGTTTATDNGDGTVTVTVDGQSACLTIVDITTGPGQVTDGACS